MVDPLSSLRELRIQSTQKQTSVNDTCVASKLKSYESDQCWSNMSSDDDPSSSWRTVQVSEVPAHLVTDFALEEALADFGPLRRCFVVRKKAEEGENAVTRGYAEFSLAEDAESCLKETGGVLKVKSGEEGGAEVKVRLKKVPDRAQQGKREKGSEGSSRPDYDDLRSKSKVAKAKRARLIVRNLSFKASEEELRAHFVKVDGAEVSEVNILTRSDGLRVGCAFVQLGNLAQAAKAIKVLNGSNLKGRKVAVDFAVGKKEYQEKEGKVKEEEEEQNDVKVEIKEEEIKEETEEDQEDEEDDDDDEGDGTTDASDEEADDAREKRSSDKPKWATGHDIGENLTVFVRNLSFNSEEQDLKRLCEDRYVMRRND